MITQVEFQLAKPEDAAHLSALALRSKGYWGYDQQFIERCRSELTYLPEHIASGSYTFIKALDYYHHQILGFYVLAHSKTTTVELEALFVEPSAIGQGIGGQLINLAKQTATQQGYTSMLIQGDPNASDFYIKFGAKLQGKKPSGSIPGRLLPTFLLPLNKQRLV
ncbi:GNAT family N-acetyltransferase [Flavobacterium sp. W21_SRS_FM6]|uniref:GNAT family N-acetyltransferase n=1 Tax=Flavobacterium sp. W21_SRS_FM6 TaxID=3240268 RepID=UPI003F91FFC0